MLSYAKQTESKGSLYGRTCSSIEDGCNTRSERKVTEDAHIMNCKQKCIEGAYSSHKKYYSPFKDVAPYLTCH